MDSTIPPSSAVRPDVVSVETSARPTPRTVGAPFSEVLAGGARALVRGATAAAHGLPGSPLMALAVRGGAPGSIASTPGAFLPEGPGTPILSTTGPGLSPTGPASGTAADGSAVGTNDPSISSALAQDQQMNLYYLQVQEEVNAQNRTYSALSNVIEVEHNTAKTAIGNIH
jgi:hypothetical protein